MTSETIDDIIEILSTFSEGRLRDRRAFARFLASGADTARAETIGELAFHGKYVTRLLGTMKKQTPESEHFEGLETEFTRTVDDFRNIVRGFAEQVGGDFEHFVRTQYLDISASSLECLLALANDFSWLKDWEIVMEESRQGGEH